MKELKLSQKSVFLPQMKEMKSKGLLLGSNERTEVINPSSWFKQKYEGTVTLSRFKAKN